MIAVQVCLNLVYDSGEHLNCVRVLGFTEHARKQTRRPAEPSSMVMVLVDLSLLVDGYGQARLIDMRPGRIAEVLRTWLNYRAPGFREHVEDIAIDGFVGYATAVDQALPAARKFLGPFHVVQLAAEKLAGCRQTSTTRDDRAAGSKDDALYKHRRSRMARKSYLSDRQKECFELLWAAETTMSLCGSPGVSSGMSSRHSATRARHGERS